MFVLGGTGSRSFAKLPEGEQQRIRLLLQFEVAKIKRDRNDLEIISGMAEGWDEELARTAVYMGIPFHAYVPHPSYGEYYWGETSVTGVPRYDEYKELLALAEKVVICSQTLYNSESGVRMHANFYRNQCMAIDGDHFLTYKPTSKGTADCIRRIRELNKEYTEIA